jgi:hypothetical protein
LTEKTLENSPPKKLDTDPEKSENSDTESCNFNENISEVSYTDFDDNDTLDLMKQRLQQPKKYFFGFFYNFQG